MRYDNNKLARQIETQIPRMDAERMWEGLGHGYGLQSEIRSQCNVVADIAFAVSRMIWQAEDVIRVVSYITLDGEEVDVKIDTSDLE